MIKIKSLKNYTRSVLALFFVIFILYYPMLVSCLNCFRTEKGLRDINVTVLEAQTKKSPNIKALSSGKNIVYFDFPSAYFGIRGWGPAFIGKENEKKLNLIIGKNATLKVDSTKYALYEKNLKVWEIDSEKTNMSFQDISIAHRDFYLSTGNLIFNFISIIFSLFLLIIVIYADLLGRNKAINSDQRTTD